MSESNLWTWLKKARPLMGDSLHMTRQENLVMVGQPDVEGCFSGNQFWLELKHAARPVRSSTKLRFGSPIKQNQIDWHAERAKAGGRVYYLISVGSGPDRVVYIIPWHYGRVMLEHGVTEADLLSWCPLFPVDMKDPVKVVIHSAEEDPRPD